MEGANAAFTADFLDRANASNIVMAIVGDKNFQIR